MAPVSITLIDDNPASLELLSNTLAAEDIAVRAFDHPEAALDHILSEHPQIVVTDLMMPGMNGMELLERVMEFDPAIDVVLVTAHYTTESAVEAIRKGAADYLNKPVSPALLRQKVGTLAERHRLAMRAKEMEATLAASSAFEGMVGNSPAMWELFSRIRRIAPHFRSVLVTGQTGTGKELIARALHQMSPARRGNFVALNCSAVVETLFESELFGHVRGAFTGAAGDKMGLFEHAHEGVLFLDEIGDMPLATQAKLLRALQNQEVQRLGSLQTRKVNVRVIAATHQNLREKIGKGGFREDLFYRLGMVELEAPALRDREGDLRLLVRHFVDKFARLYDKKILGITNRAQMVLSRHSWPGNVRELENVIGHAAMMAMATMIDVPDLPAYLTQPSQPTPAATLATTPPANDLPALQDQEKALLLSALAKAGDNQSEAARLLRISRDTLRYRLKKHGIKTGH
jgi:DNA-binding NtrC family response regulator